MAIMVIAERNQDQSSHGPFPPLVPPPWPRGTLGWGSHLMGGSAAQRQALLPSWPRRWQGVCAHVPGQREPHTKLQPEGPLLLSAPPSLSFRSQLTRPPLLALGVLTRPPGCWGLHPGYQGRFPARVWGCIGSLVLCGRCGQDLS